MAINIYTAAEQETLRASGRILASVFTTLAPLVRPGITPRELDERCYDVIEEAGALPSFLGYKGFPASLCASVNAEVLHGIPGDRPLEEGDLLTLDIGVRYRGLCTDRAQTYPVGRVSAEAQKLISYAESSLAAGIAAVRPGATVGDLGNAIQKVIEEGRFAYVREYCGHGVGHHVHEEPSILNYGRPGTGPKLKAGMVLALEPMLCAGGPEIKVLSDNWTVVTRDGRLSSHAEHTVIVREDGAEIITA